MARRRRAKSGDLIELIVKGVFLACFLIALSIGGIRGFPRILGQLTGLVLVLAIAVAAVVVAFVLGRFFFRRSREKSPGTLTEQLLNADAASNDQPPPRLVRPPIRTPQVWTEALVLQKLNEIDWYQFEKFCAALLEADDFSVERKGGAHPDGGVDLLVEKAGARALIQCKHWRTWNLKESVVREMLGSMTHFSVKQGAIYTLKGWTEPAAELAAQHDITLVNGYELAKSAVLQLTPAKLSEVLDSSLHHCPKCEAPMVWRTGDFTPFWGCSRYPRCHGKLNRTGAR